MKTGCGFRKPIRRRGQGIKENPVMNTRTERESDTAQPKKGKNLESLRRKRVGLNVMCVQEKEKKSV